MVTYDVDKSVMLFRVGSGGGGRRMNILDVYIYLVRNYDIIII